MNTMLAKIKHMHQQFNIDCGALPTFSSDERDFRVVAMQEELDEYQDAYDRHDQLDALVDLVVFALGTAERQGFLESFEEAFDRVMTANCAKQIGRNTKRGNFQIDLIKPSGWTAPDLSDLV